jgi:anti-sigma factor (TIGR02949 family)
MSARADDDAACSDECSQALRLLEAYLDGELADTEVEDIREHLTACYPCTERASFEEQLRAIVRRDCVEQAPPTLVSRIESALQQRLGGLNP